MAKGYAGKIIHVDLTAGKIEIEEPAEEFYRTYVGGSAMGTYYLLKKMPAGAEQMLKLAQIYRRMNPADPE